MNKATRLLLKIRAKYLCEYCLSPEYFSPDPFTADHIIPYSMGGSDDLINRALACWGCNGNKSDATHAFDPATGQLTMLYNPRTDNWADHFRWNESFTLLIGISPVGRATIVQLKLNRENIINLRSVLHKAGHHP